MFPEVVSFRGCLIPFGVMPWIPLAGVCKTLLWKVFFLSFLYVNYFVHDSNSLLYGNVWLLLRLKISLRSTGLRLQCKSFSIFGNLGVGRGGNSLYAGPGWGCSPQVDSRSCLLWQVDHCMVHFHGNMLLVLGGGEKFLRFPYSCTLLTCIFSITEKLLFYIFFCLNGI